jgi:hypothetical protein
MTRHTRSLSLAVGLACLASTACESTTTAPIPVTPTISITPSAPITLSVGQQATVSGIVTGLATNAVIYSSSNPASITVNAATGVVTCVSPGTGTITATSTEQATLRASVQVTCIAAPGSTSTTYNVTISVASDPHNHREFVQYDTVRTVVGIRTGATLTATGPSPWVTLTGTINTDGTFVLTGSGTVAGRPNVGVRWTGTAQGNSLSGRIVVGTGGELPDGPIEYDLTGTAQ